VPFGREVARANRQFMVRAVQFMARSGIDQFIDLAPAFPPSRTCTRSPGTPARCPRSLRGQRPDGMRPRPGPAHDERRGGGDPRGYPGTPGRLDDPVTRALIDFARPVAVLFVAVLHFLTDEDRPWEQVAAFRWRMTSGSMLAVSHITLTTRHSMCRQPSRPSTPKPAPGGIPDPAGYRDVLRGWIWQSPVW